MVAWACLQVVGYSVLGASLAEFLSYALIFRTSAYQRLTASIDKVTQRIEKKQSANAGQDSKQKSRQKKIDRIEKSLGPAERGLAMIKAARDTPATQSHVPAAHRWRMTIRSDAAAPGAQMRVAVLGMISHACTFALLYNSFSGIVVARLPFTPFAFMRGLTHRALDGDDMSDCSVVFLYALCSIAIKPNLQRALGFAPAMKQADPFGTRLPSAPSTTFTPGFRLHHASASGIRIGRSNRSHLPVFLSGCAAGMTQSLLADTKFAK